MPRRSSIKLAMNTCARVRTLQVRQPQLALPLTTSSFSRSMSTSMPSTNSNSNGYQSPYADYFQSLSSQPSTSSATPTSSAATTQTTQGTKLKCGISESVLKFKTTSYPRLMSAPFVQPSEYKVTLQVHLDNLPLHSALECEIFEQIVGSRYNKNDSQVLTLTSNHFASRIENKRHLCSMLDRIVIGAKRLASDSNSDSDGN